MLGMRSHDQSKTKTWPLAGFLFFAGVGGFEPPTSAMSRLIGRNKTSVDATSLMDEFALDNT